MHRMAWFGETTEDEMCFNFVYVYPIENVSGRQCFSPLVGF